MRQLIVFDLDDTLCDYAAARERALDATLGSVEGVDLKSAVARWGTEEPRLFRRMLDEDITLSDYRRQRFLSALADQLRVDQDALDLDLLNLRYMHLANGGVKWLPGARAAVEAVRQEGVLTAVLTNGPADGQREKVGALDLDDAVDSVHISELCGFAKPDPRALRCVLDELDVSPEQAIMIGDDDADLECAAAAGMTSFRTARPDRPAVSGRSIEAASAEALAQLRTRRRG